MKILRFISRLLCSRKDPLENVTLAPFGVTEATHRGFRYNVHGDAYASGHGSSYVKEDAK